MLADGGRLVFLVAVWSPDLDCEVRGGRYESGIVLREGDVVDPVRVRVCLRAEAGRGLRLRAAGRVAFGEIEIQVPCAYDAVAAAGVSVVGAWSALLRAMARWSLRRSFVRRTELGRSAVGVQLTG